MKRFFEYFLFAFAFVFGAALVFVVAALFFKVDVFGLFITSATKVVGVFGDRFPLLSTPYGRVQIRSKASDKGQLIEIGCAECRLENRLLASIPFTTDNAVLEGVFQKKHFIGEARVEQLSLKIDALWSDNNVSGSFDLPTTEIAKLFHAARTIVPEAEKAQITGTVGGEGKFSWPEIFFSFKPDIRSFTVNGLVDEKAYSSGSFTYFGEDAFGKPVELTSGEGSPQWVPLEKLGRYLPAAVIAVEDRGFYSHPGYDLRSINDATAYNKRSGRVRRGASTLSQQLSKNLFLTDERTYARKLRELLYAVEIDRELGKKRIMELYLNIVEFGPDIFGAKAAAKVYFNKLPDELLPEEAAWLANILRSPKKAYERQFKKLEPNRTHVSLTLDTMTNLSDSEKTAAMSRPLIFANH